LRSLKKKLEQTKQNGGENKKKTLIRDGPNSSSFPELIENLSKNPEIIFVVIWFSIRIQNLKFLGSKMAKIQGSDGLMGKRKIAILNIASILNKFFFGQLRCQSACYNNSKMGLYVEIG
jgi:hypothetical protein